MSVLKILFAVLAVAIILLVFFNINILQNKWLLLGVAGLIIVFLALAFFRIIGKIISLVVGILAFLFILLLLSVLLKII